MTEYLSIIKKTDDEGQTFETMALTNYIYVLIYIFTNSIDKEKISPQTFRFLIFFNSI